jgi:hypothetical protein
MFDIKQEIAVSIDGPDGPKQVVVAYPSDAQLSEWRRKVKLYEKTISGPEEESMLESTPPGPADLELINAIRIFDKEAEAPQIDEYEARLIIEETLIKCSVTEKPERENNRFTIRMSVVTGLKTSHVLRVPTVRERMEYSKAAARGYTYGKYNTSQIKVNYIPAGELYDKLKVETEGYAQGIVPVVHKAEAINVLLQEMKPKSSSGE